MSWWQIVAAAVGILAACVTCFYWGEVDGQKLARMRRADERLREVVRAEKERAASRFFEPDLGNGGAWGGDYVPTLGQQCGAEMPSELGRPALLCYLPAGHDGGQDTNHVGHDSDRVWYAWGVDIGRARVVRR